ncbi:MAG TPA: carboxypeptidase M32 [Verrucomicrobiae bacterium]|nr:carboxypeptidase M32 [Verrucomicrobiae bacterium]
MANGTYEKFKEKLVEINHLSHSLGLMEWDSNVSMPTKGSKRRGEAIGTLSGLIHEKFLSKDLEVLLLKLKKDLDQKKLDSKQSVVVREVFRVYSKEKKLPSDFVKEMAETVSHAYPIWDKAKKESNFKLFAPQLKKIFELKRKYAQYVGYKGTPYDVLLDDYEPGLTSEEASLIFSDLKDFLIPFIKKIGKKKGINRQIKGKFDLAKQREFNTFVAKKIGYDFEAGRLDESSHPFTINFHPHDVRITTKYKEDDFYFSLGSTVHEIGHALYEQGLNPEHFGTPLAESISLGVHESQSRTWENLVGKSMPFWKYFYPFLQKTFPEPFKKMKLDEFYPYINQVEPSLIRYESDEVTYNLHIIIRFEIEKELVEGSIDVGDLPKIWNSKYKDYLGITIPDDAHGVLQDVHWANGLVGYFPTYTLGNLYSAQFYQQAKKEIMNLEKFFEKGKFQPFLEWLRKNIHQHGKQYSAAQLCERITGEGLNSKYYIDYLTTKFNKLYSL